MATLKYLTLLSQSQACAGRFIGNDTSIIFVNYPILSPIDYHYLIHHIVCFHLLYDFIHRYIYCAMDGRVLIGVSGW